jgi:toxin-antitoxin system PIN domain toxin
VRALLDVNLLVALFDPAHVHHGRARSWWSGERNRGWASCPLTQNGFLRVVSNPGYPRPLTPGQALAALRAQIALPGHAFWPDDASIADADLFDHRRIVGPGQITDVYLLALAVKNGGRLATFDRAIPLAAVRGALARHLAVPG